MKKGLKWLFRGLGILVVILILAIIFLPMIFKGKINEIVKEQANANINAKLEYSDLSLSLIRSFPSFSVRIEDLSISGINEFENDTLVKFNYFQTDLNLMSVMFGDVVEIKSIILDQPKIKAIVLEDGKANWDIAKADSTAAVEEEIDTTSSSSYKIALKKFKINEADVLYDDRQGNMQAQVDNFNFLLKGDLSESESKLKMTSGIDKLNFIMGKISYMKDAKVKFNSEIAANMDSMAFTFKDNEFGLNDILLVFEGNVKMPTDDIDIDVKFNTTKTDFKSVLSLVPAIYMKDFKDVKTEGKFDINGFVKGVYNEKNLPAFAANLVVENAMFKYPDLPKSVTNINVDASLVNKGGSGDNNIVDLKKAHAEIAQNPIDAKMYIVTDAKDVDMKGNLTAKLDFESIADAVPLDSMTIKGLLDANLDMAGKLSDIEKEKYDRFKAEGHVKLTNFEYTSSDLPKPVNISSALMNFTPAYVNLQNCDMTIGSSDMHLNGKLDNILAYAIQDSTLQGRFNFSSNNLDASDLMGDETVAETPETTESADTSALTAFEIPSNIDFLLNSKLKKVKYDKLLITDLDGDILLKNSKAMFRNVKMNMLGGSMSMSGSYDAKHYKKPKVDFDLGIQNFNIPAAFEAFNTVQKLAPIAKKANGKFSLDLGFAGDLDYNLNPVYETLNGKGLFQSKEISIANAKSLEKLAAATKWKKLANPSLKDLAMKFKIENGNITVDPTKMNFGKSELEFGGSQNLNKNINYKIGMNIPRKELGEAINKLSDNLLAKTGKQINLAENLKMDVFVKGTLDNPKFSLTGAKGEGSVKDQIKEKAKEAVKEEAKKVIEDVDKKAQEIIAKAKAQADKIKAEAKEKGEKLVAEADKKGEELKSQADKEAKDLVEKASNPIAKMGANKAAKVLKDKADKAAKKLHDEAQNKADQLNKQADEQANAIIKKAEDQVAQSKKKANDKVG